MSFGHGSGVKPLGFTKTDSLSLSANTLIENRLAFKGDKNCLPDKE